LWWYITSISAARRRLPAGKNQIPNMECYLQCSMQLPHINSKIIKVKAAMHLTNGDSGDRYSWKTWFPGLATTSHVCKVNAFDFAAI